MLNLIRHIPIWHSLLAGLTRPQTAVVLYCLTLHAHNSSLSIIAYLAHAVPLAQLVAVYICIPCACGTAWLFTHTTRRCLHLHTVRMLYCLHNSSLSTFAYRAHVVLLGSSRTQLIAVYICIPCACGTAWLFTHTIRRCLHLHTVRMWYCLALHAHNSSLSIFAYLAHVVLLAQLVAVYICIPCACGTAWLFTHTTRRCLYLNTLRMWYCLHNSSLSIFAYLVHVVLLKSSRTQFVAVYICIPCACGIILIYKPPQCLPMVMHLACAFVQALKASMLPVHTWRRPFVP